MVLREFEKKVTNVGGTNGIIIPDWICKAEKIERGMRVRLTVELLEDKESLKNTRQSQDLGLYCSPATLSSNYPGEVLS